MRVLVSLETRVRPDSTGVYIIEAFKQLGHEVAHVLPEHIHNVHGGYDLYVKVDDGQRVTQWNPELHPSAYYCIDTHIESDWRIALARDGRFDSVSVAHHGGLALDWGRNDVYWNPVGCDPKIHYVGAREKRFDGCFIGNFHNNLAGPRVEALDSFFKACKGPIFFGNRIFQEVTEKYAESKLVFNRSINGDANMRVFEALCSGSCLVTDRVPDLQRLGFVDGVHYVGYDNPVGAGAAANDLLIQDERRQTIAAAGREFVVANHTYAHRMNVLLQKLNLHTKEREHVNA
jgi:spore maturation protein CgeB